MHISTLGESPEGFYLVSHRELWEGLIDPKIMTQEQLMTRMIEGIKQYNILFPPRQPAWWEKMVPTLMMAGAAGVAIAMSGTVVAAGGAAASSSAAATTATTATGATAAKASAVALAQKSAASLAASTVVKKAAAEVAAKGGDTSEKLSFAAQLYEKYSPQLTNVASAWVQGQIQRANGKLGDEAQNALSELMGREQENYINWMKREAAERSEIAQGPLQQPTPPAAPIPWTTILAVATPFILLMVRG